MKLPADRQTRRYLLAAGTCGILSLGLVYWSESKAGLATAQLHQARQALQQLELALQQSAQDAESLRTNQPRFEQMQARGWMTKRPPQGWADILLQQQAALHLPALSYEFHPSLTLPAPDGVQHHLRKTALDLHLELLHEEDLLRLLENLPEQLKALSLIRSCQLWRKDRQGLDADCQIELITLEATGS